jgi:hypothetical protein
MIFRFFLKNFYFGVLHQAVRVVSKNRPKYPMLDIPNGMSSFEDLGRFFETAYCTAWPSAPQKIKNKYIFELLLFNL